MCAGTGAARSALPGRRLLLGLFAAAALLALSASSASAANPTILNQNTGCSGQTSWLVSCATGGQTDNGANILRVSALVNHDIGNTIPSLVTDDDWDDTVDPDTVRSVSAQRPNIAGGYPRSRANLSYTLPTTNTGMSCGFSSTRRTTDRDARIQARDNIPQTSATSSSQIKFVATGQCLGFEDFAYLYGWGANNFVNSTALEPGDSKTFTYNGDDKDTTGDSDFQGVRWRTRNLRTGALSGETVSCPNNGDNATKSLTVAFPDRGAFVVEAELLDGGGCTQDQNPDFWFPIGTADVNSANAPSLTVGASRPQFNGNTTVTAGGLVDPDNSDGGRSEYIEWDLDGNAGNGVAGFETTTIGDHVSGLTAPQTKTHSTAGETPGLHTVRARVTDNGAMAAADSIRRTSGVVTAQYLVDSAPVANNQGVDVESGNSIPITLTGSDPDGDSLTFSITDQPDHGSLDPGTTGPNQTYTADATFAGTDTFQFQVNDGFGRTATGTVTVRVDPQTNITLTPPDPSNDETPEFQFASSVTETAVTFECRLDSTNPGDFAPCSSPFEVTPELSEGLHTFDVRAIAAGNTDPTPASYTWEVDVTEPDTTITSTPPDPSNDTTPAFEFESDSPNSTFECQVDGAGFTSCDSGDEFPVSGDGLHTFEVRAIDDAGNVDPDPASYTWTLDTTAPVVDITVFPPDPSNSDDADFEFTVDDGTADIECELDGGGFTDCDTATSQSYTDLSDGSHTFIVRATDPATNAGSDTYTWEVDTVDPVASIDTFPPDPSSDTTPEFTFSSNEDPDATFECRIDSDQEADFAPCASPFTTPELSDGDHTLEVRAIDTAGNVGDPDSYTWTVDTIAPVTTIDSAPENPTSSVDATFEFSSNEDPDVTFECRLDSTDEVDFEPCASPQNYLGLSEDTHTFDVRATDLAGNVGDPASYTWEIDITDPDTTIDTGPPAESTSSVAVFESSSDESPDVSFECRLDSGDPDNWEECSSPQLYADLAEGSHTLEVRAIDFAGNTDPSPASHSWTIDTSTPDTEITSGPSGTVVESEADFEFSSDDPAATFECSLDGAPFAPCASPQAYSSLDDGSHTFRVRARDQFGNPDPTPAGRSWKVDSQGPTVTITSGPSDPTDSTAATFEFSSNEPGTTFKCSVDDGPDEDCDSGAEFTALADGPHTFEVYGIDEVGNSGSAASAGWEVDTTPPTVLITGTPPPVTSSAHAEFQFTSPSDGAGATFECSLDDGPFQDCASPRVYDGLDDGDHSFEVRPVDDAGNTGTAGAYEWTIAESDPPDTLIDAGPADGTLETDAEFTFHSNEAGATFQCSIDGGAFAGCTSPASYTDLTVGEEHSFRVKAIDTDSNQDPSPAEYEWTIAEPAPPPPPPSDAPTPAPAGAVAGATTQPAPTVTQPTCQTGFKLKKKGKKRRCVRKKRRKK